MSVSYFSQNKGERETKKAINVDEVRTINAASLVRPAPDVVSTLGRGMVITGNIVSDGSVQIHGRVIGDIHVSHLVICDGAQVEGNIVAQEVAIHGAFKGTVRGNNVKLHGKAMIDGEIYNKSLTIEENVQFEGVSRRLDKPVEVPSAQRSAHKQVEVVRAPSISGTVS